MSRRLADSTTTSPFYDKEFAAQPITWNTRKPPPAPPPKPDRLSTNIECRECNAPARIEVHPSKTIYRCPGCQNLLATMYPTAEVTTP